MTSRSPVLTDLYTEEIYKIQDRVLILITDPWESIPQSDKTLLSKILGAANLSLDAVQLVVQRGSDLSMLHSLSPKWVIHFTNEDSGAIPYYSVADWEGYPIIRSHKLSDLDDARKKSLWIALKGLIQR